MRPLIPLLAFAVLGASGTFADPGDPPAPASPRLVVARDVVPDLPASPPDRFLVLPFSNDSGVRALDWAVAGLPAAIADKLEEVFPLDPAGGELFVDGAPFVADAGAIAARATPVGARWVVTGRATRTQWELDFSTALWRVEGGGATPVVEVRRQGPFPTVHTLVGEVLVELAQAAGWRVGTPQLAPLTARPTEDFYAFTLLGRGLGRFTGALDGAGPRPPGAPPIALTPADVAAAERDLTRAVFIDPRFALAQRLLGELWARHGRDPRAAARAVGKFNHALDLSPTSAPALRAAAAAARAAGKREGWRELATRRVMRRPWDLDARLDLGEALWAVGDSPAAERELERVLARDPARVGARRVLVLLRADGGDLPGLVAELEALRPLVPDDLSVVRELAAAYAATGRSDDAVAALRVLLAATPGDATLWLRLGDLERWRGAGAAAGEAYAQAQVAAPEDPRPLFAAAALARDERRLDDATALLVRAQRDPELGVFAQHESARVAFDRGQLSEAQWYLRRVIKARPRALAPRLGMIVVELARRDVAAATAQLAAARAGWPQDPSVRYLAGHAALAKGDRTAARVEFAAAAPTLAAAAAALAQLDTGGTPVLAMSPPADPPLGDPRDLAAQLDAFLRADARLTEARERFFANARAALGSLGRGPAVPGRAAARARSCPLGEVVPPWRTARTARADFLSAGLEVERVGAWIARADRLGDAALLLPDQRAAVGRAVAALRRAQADLREVGAMWDVALGRELTYLRCSPGLLAAAAEDPRRYPARPTRLAPPPARKPLPPPRRAAFYVDNRACAERVTVFVDGQRAGEVPGGDRLALSAPIGRRALCLLTGGHGACGDRGTVRQAYLHDGWEAVLRCPDGRPAPTPLP